MKLTTGSLVRVRLRSPPLSVLVLGGCAKTEDEGPDGKGRRRRRQSHREGEGAAGRSPPAKPRSDDAAAAASIGQAAEKAKERAPRR